MKIVSVYAALLALLFIFLSVRAIGVRRRVRVAVGDGGNAQMLRAMRVHANFAEYVPLALVLAGFAELQGAPAWLLHAVGGVLLVARASHAYGVSQAAEDFRFRVAGMMGTFGVIGTASAWLLGVALHGALA